MSGLALLKEYRTSTGATQEQLAARSGLTQGYLALVLAGDRIPGTRGALGLERATRGAVPASAWLTDLAARERKRKLRRRSHLSQR